MLLALSSLMLLAQERVGGFGAWGIGQIAIAIVVIAAVVALVFVAVRQFGIVIPQWVAQIFWIVVIAFVVIVAIKIVLTL